MLHSCRTCGPVGDIVGILHRMPGRAINFDADLTSLARVLCYCRVSYILRTWHAYQIYVHCGLLNGLITLWGDYRLLCFVFSTGFYLFLVVVTTELVSRNPIINRTQWNAINHQRVKPPSSCTQFSSTIVSKQRQAPLEDVRDTGTDTGVDGGNVSFMRRIHNSSILQASIYDVVCVFQMTSRAMHIRHDQCSCRSCVRREMNTVVTHFMKPEESITLFRSFNTEHEANHTTKRNQTRSVLHRQQRSTYSVNSVGWCECLLVFGT